MVPNVRSFVIYWNSLFPIDLWWRYRHKTPFNSSAHREMNMIDMMFEYVEFTLTKDDGRIFTYDPKLGNWLNESKKSEKELDYEFDNIDLGDIVL